MCSTQYGVKLCWVKSEAVVLRLDFFFYFIPLKTLQIIGQKTLNIKSPQSHSDKDFSLGKKKEKKSVSGTQWKSEALALERNRVTCSGASRLQWLHVSQDTNISHKMH